MRVGYGKIGRSMPLSITKCGSLGGDVEMAATIGELARRNPESDFYLIGKNSGEEPTSVGLPSNVHNPWIKWGPQLLDAKRRTGLNHANYSVADHLALQDIYDSVTLDFITKLDGIVLWAGQHGTTNVPLPGVREPGKYTKPHDWSAHYVAFLTRAINIWRDVNPWKREEIWLNSDPRNYLKLRDLKWPLRHPVLAQHTYHHRIKHARYGDPGPNGAFEEWSATCDLGVETPSDVDKVWKASVRNVYARLEVNGLLPSTPFGDLLSFNDRWEDRAGFGLFMNETRRYVRQDITRSHVMREWVLPLEPAWIHGTWSQAGQEEINREITPAPWGDYVPKLHSVRCTFTSPASGTGWATAKPWEAFAAGTVCFFHPGYDVQDNILGDAPLWLKDWLRVTSPDELVHRVKHLSSDAGRTDWYELVAAQRIHFNDAVRELRFARLIEARLGLRGTGD